LFAPLVSTYLDPHNDLSLARSSRLDMLRPTQESQDVLLSLPSPTPASPKSVYRLADYLSLDDLKQLALAHLVSRLTPTNALYELYGDVATVYPAVRDAVLDYVVANWNEVKTSAAVQHVEESAEAGALRSGAAKTAMLLAARLGQVGR